MWGYFIDGAHMDGGYCTAYDAQEEAARYLGYPLYWQQNRGYDTKDRRGNPIAEVRESEPEYIP